MGYSKFGPPVIYLHHQPFCTTLFLRDEFKLRTTGGKDDLEIAPKSVEPQTMPRKNVPNFTTTHRCRHFFSETRVFLRIEARQPRVWIEIKQLTHEIRARCSSPCVLETFKKEKQTHSCQKILPLTISETTERKVHRTGTDTWGPCPPSF